MVVVVILSILLATLLPRGGALSLPATISSGTTVLTSTIPMHASGGNNFSVISLGCRATEQQHLPALFASIQNHQDAPRGKLIVHFSI